MKLKIFLVLLFVSTFSFAQNWSQVGSTQFTNFSTDGAMTFDNVGMPYMVYVNPTASNKAYVKKFNGTSWVDLTTPEVSTEGSANVIIKVNPISNEPWVAYRRTSDSKFDVYRFDGTNWIAVTTAEGAGDLLNAKLQMQFSVSGNLRIAGQYNAKGVHFYTQTTGVWTVNNYYHSSGNTIQTSVDLVNYEQFFYQYDLFGASYYGKRTLSGTNFFHQGLSSRNFREISGISDENIVSANNLSSYSGAIWFSDAGTSKGRPLNTNGSKIGYLKLRKSITDDNYYIMFADSNDDLVFQKNKRIINQWSNLPTAGINTTPSNFFASMEMNPVNGDMYLMYLDGARVSVKKYSIPVEIPKPRIYVNVNATGNNDGTSFVDGYTSLQVALSNIEPVTTEIWITSGTYTPDNSSKYVSFVFNTDNINIYGGFIGTETSINERDLINNETILDGDLNGDGNRNGNSLHVVKAYGNNMLLDGLTIVNGFAHVATGVDSRGSLILKNDTVTDLTLKNVKLKNGYGTIASGIYASFGNGGNLTIENSVFNNNDSKYGSGLYVLTGNNQRLNVKISNSLFDNNRSRNFGSAGYAGSAFWVRANGSNSTVDAKIINCTFSNNTDTGTQSVAERSTVGMGRSATGTFNAEVSNCIFYGNTTTGGATSISIGRVHTSAPNFTAVNNSIGEDSFSNLNFLTNTSNVDPLFTDVANNDFTLQVGSSAINTGDNTKILSGITTDLLGNQRVFNTTVDMGCYEFGSGPIISYTLTTNTVGQGTVTPVSGAIYNSGTIATITAIPNAGWQFDGWSGDLSGTTNPVQLTMDANKSVTATFSQITYTLTTITVGQGTVTPVNGTVYNDGAIATITATPTTGWQFDGWSGDLSGTTNPAQLTMDADKSVTATFSQITHTLTTTTVGNGAVTPSGTTTHNENAVVSVTATPDAGWSFDGWSGDSTSVNSTINITMDANKNLVANFSQIQYELTIIATNGSATPDSGTLNNGVYIYNAGTNVEITPTPNTGYVFDRFEITDSNNTTTSTNNPLAITMNDNIVVEVFFTATYTLTTSVVGSGSVAPNGTTTHNENDVVSVTATPNVGWSFDGWSGDNTSVNSTINVTMDANKNLVANFSQIEYELTIIATNGTATPDSGILNNGVYVYNTGTNVEITPTPNAGYVFDRFEITDSNNTTTSTNNPLAITMNDNMVVEVFFTATYTLTTSVVGSGSVAPSGTTTHNENDVVSVTAIPVTGWSFDGWSGDSTSVNSTINVTMDANKNLVANFSQIQYELTIIATNGIATPDSGTLNNGVYVYNTGTNVEITPTPNTGYVFDRFEITDSNNTTTSTNNPLAITMNDNMVVEVFFTPTYTLTTNTVGQGTVTPTNGTTYNDGDIATLTAIPASGWQFDGWSGDLSGTTNPGQLTMDADKSVTATFSQITYTLTTITVGQGTITPANGTVYNDGDITTITAIPTAGWQFDGWNGDLSGTTNPAQLMMNADKSVTATFSQITHTLTTITVGQGTITPANGTVYNDGDIATITAIPTAGWQFDGWSGDLSGTTNPSQLTMDADKSVTATFSQMCIISIPDVNFKNALLSNTTINTDGNTEISCAEAIAFTGTIDVQNQGISDLTGIETFVNITELNCQDNQLSSLNVSQNTALTYLNCYTNQISSLDVTNNVLLTYLSCSRNQLTSLDISQNTVLEILGCGDNQLTSLDISNNTALEELHFYQNNITSMDVSSLSNLTALNAVYNSLTYLNVANGNNTNFTQFHAANNSDLTCIQVDDVAYSDANWTDIDSQTSFSVNCNLSVENFDVTNFSVYPNPATNHITIESTQNIKQVSVYTVLGQEVIISNEKTIDVSRLEIGMYLVKIVLENGKFNTKNFIKR